MSLYQKYRPSDLADLVGQSFVRKALLSALSSGKTVGAYLFCGSRGTGKTSVARILAKALNCTALLPDGNPCGQCVNCEAALDGSMLDIIEIDGASNNGVANVRELIERARFQPSMGRYKVYIIDEVHMLSTGAFNALLKILEEPPDHVKFILATTESHKIPDTIISRSQRYDFRKISEADIIARLEHVAKLEEIEAEPQAVALIAKLARGGLRDALSLFEQYTIAGRLSYDFVMDNLSLLGDEFLADLTANILSGDTRELLAQIVVLRERSVDPKRFLDELLGYLRNTATEALGTPRFVPVWRLFGALAPLYNRLKDFPDGVLLLEMTMLGYMSPEATAPARSVPPAKSVETLTPRTAPVIPKPQSATLIEKIAAPLAEPRTPEVHTETLVQSTFSFPVLVEHVKSTPRKAVLLTALKSGTFKLSTDPAIFTLFSRSEFERAKLDTPESQEYLVRSIEELFGIQVQVRFVLQSGGAGVPIISKPDIDARTIADIF